MRTSFRAIARVLVARCSSGAAPAGAQQFTGGVRGAVRDANGVIPGVAVTLTNEATNISREVVTNDVGQYNFPAVPPGTYTLKVADLRIQDLRIEGHRRRHAAVRHAGRRARSRRDRGERHGHRPVAAHRHVDRVDGRRADRRGARIAAGARPQRVPDRHHRPDRDAGRRPAVQPPAGSDQRLARLARRRRHPRQQLPARRRADHRNCAAAPCSTRRSKRSRRSRSRSTPTTPRWAGPAAACST